MAAAAGPAEVDLVDLARGPVTLRAEALSTGLPLYESEPGAWANSQMAATLERWDTAWLRELDLHLMARPRSMTPATPDRDVVHQRLRLVRELLDDLEAYRGRTGADLTADRTSRYVVERLLTAMVEVAASVNSHLAASSLGRGLPRPTGNPSWPPPRPGGSPTTRRRHWHHRPGYATSSSTPTARSTSTSWPTPSARARRLRRVDRTDRRATHERRRLEPLLSSPASTLR